MSEDLCKGWRNIKFSDPNSHDPKQYIYLVHAIKERDIIRDLIKKEKGCKEEQYDLIENPRDISKMGIISCSLIGRGKDREGREYEQLETWADIGLILKVPIENILRSGNSDLGANFVDSNAEINRYKNDYKGDPYALLYHSVGYNEVVVQGKTEFGEVEVVGAFINEYTKPCTEARKEAARKIAQKVGGKLIEIPKKEIKLSDEPIHIEKKDGKLSKISFTRNNRNFYCNLARRPWDLTWGIYATGDYGAPFIENEEDLNMFLDELKNLPKDDKEKYSEIIELIPSQYELCKKYLKKEVTKEEVNSANHLLEKFDENVQNPHQEQISLGAIGKRSEEAKTGDKSGVTKIFDGWIKMMRPKKGDPTKDDR